MKLLNIYLFVSIYSDELFSVSSTCCTFNRCDDTLKSLKLKLKLSFNL